MLLRRGLELRSFIVKTCLLRASATTTFVWKIQKYSGFTSCTQLNPVRQQQKPITYQRWKPILSMHRKWFSKGLIDGDTCELKEQSDLKKISELFPEARVTLHILSQRVPEKMYDIHYKQHMPGKKAVRNQEWTCTYKFAWPEKMKFESMAISKRVAAEKAALQGLQWLYLNNRIDSKGNPIYKRNIINEIMTDLNEPICAEISEQSAERLQNIWNDYDNGIKQIYEKTAENARLKAIEAPAQLIKDSTIDAEDEYPEENDHLEELLPTGPDNRGPVHPVYGRVLTPPTAQTLKRRNEALERTFQNYDESITPLPIDEYAGQITSTLDENRVCVIVGAAGCGKSTRVPAAILRRSRVGAKVVVSEPRRVAAIGLAERVASELCEEVGESIGYQVRLHSKPPRPPAGSVLYCTSGVLLNRLHSNPGLEGCSHVIIDEAHERDVNTDITLLLLKRAMDVNPELKLVVMSATLDTDVFTKYFNQCPVIEIPGRTYPVDVSYLEDIQKKYRLNLPNTLANCEKEDGRPQLNVAEITQVIKAVDKHEIEGAILVFLPGWAEIKYAKQVLDAQYANSTLHMILPVHSRLSTTDQTKMFAKPGLGVRKIVLATNVAETSVTIPDVVHVIDAGAHKENTLREGTGTASLETVWVSLAGAKQRAGRAGRVQPGHCYRLYTKEKEAQFVPHRTPEILRVPLEQTVLDCKTYAPEDKAAEFLSLLPEPPSLKAVRRAVKDLTHIGALTPTEKLTRLGSLLSTLPLSPRAGLALLRGVSACGALSAANVAVHADNNTELFINAADRREEIREIKRRFNPASDHAALHWIQDEFENELRSTNWNSVDQWCDKYFLKKERLAYVKSLSSLYLRELLKTGIIERNVELPDINRFSDIDELSVATLFAGVDALLVTKRNVRTKGKLKTVTEVITTTGERAHIASESVNFSITKRTNKPTLIAYCGGHHSTERRALMVYKSSVLSPQAALLFYMGHVDRISTDGNTAVLSIPRHKLKIQVSASNADILLKAREMLWSTFDYHVERDIRDLQYEEVAAAARFKIRLMKAVCRVLVEAADKSINDCDSKLDDKDLGGINYEV